MPDKLKDDATVATAKAQVTQLTTLCKNKPALAKVLEGLQVLAKATSKLVKGDVPAPDPIRETYNKLLETYNGIVAKEKEAEPKEAPVAYKLGGVDCDDADDLIKKIKAKSEVTSSMEGSVAQCVNGLIKEKGSGHVSHGVVDTEKACTLFFKKDGNTYDVVDIARHIKEKNAVRYTVVWGKRKGKVVGPGAPT